MDPLYAEEILDHYRRPHHQGTLDVVTHTASGHNPLCGDEINYTLQIEDDTIVDVAWEGTGCAISQAAASMLADELIGMSFAAATELSSDDMLELIVVPLSPVRLKCGLLAWATVQEAIKKK